MSDDHKSWLEKPLFASWIGRLLWLLLFVVPDIVRTIYPNLWMGLELHIAWDAALIVITLAIQWQWKRMNGLK